MEAFKLFASGGQSIDEFARNIYIKNNLTQKFSETIQEIKNDLVRIRESSCDSLHQFDNKELIVTDVTIKSIDDFLIIIESIILHGLKEKLSFSRVLSPVKFTYNSPTSFSLQSNRSEPTFPDFWPIILILNHNQVNLSLKNLNNISTDVGRCRAWIRLVFYWKLKNLEIFKNFLF